LALAKKRLRETKRDPFNSTSDSNRVAETGDPSRAANARRMTTRNNNEGKSEERVLDQTLDEGWVVDVGEAVVGDGVGF
jgi:hypothetical protein